MAKTPGPDFVPAFMHNGFFTNLRDVIVFYNTRDLGGFPPPEVQENMATEIGNLGLTDEDIDAIVAFLETLSDGFEVTPSAAMPVTLVLPAASFPNPFSEGTDIRWSLPEPGPVTVRIFDPAGREVRTLLENAAFAQGTGSVRWDGTDAGGRNVAAGVYFLRVDTDRPGPMQRIVRLR